MVTRMSTISQAVIFLYILLLSLYITTTVLGFSSVEVGDDGSNANIRCIERERDALVMIKKQLVDADGLLSSWMNEDCCKWRGVSCSNRMGHVVELNLGGFHMEGNISSSLLELQHLDSLDLSYNYFGGKLIPDFIGSLAELRYLNLSSSGFSGRVPYQLGNLSRLHSLDLSDNHEMYNVGKLEWLSHLSSLRHIRLNDVDLKESIDWMQVISQLPSLVELELVLCYLPSVHFSSSISFVNSSKSLALLDLSANDLSNSQDFWFWLSHFSTSLVHLDLSESRLQGHIPDYAFSNMTSLMHLDLSRNNLQDPIPDFAFPNVSSLLYLDLSSNEIAGGIPKSFGNFCRLKTLLLDYNNLNTQLPELFVNLSGCTKDTLEILSLNGNMLSGSLPDFTLFSSLRELYLEDNRLNGTCPKRFQQLSDLTILSLRQNQLEGSLPDLGVFFSLENLDISNNRLNGTLTTSTGQLSRLEKLDASSNSLGGIITEAHMSNLSKLTYLDLSSNSFTLNFSSDWEPSFQLEIIRLGACKMGPHFPKWLKTQHNFTMLDISSAEISDIVPDWFWDLSPSLNHLNLSHNRLSGLLPDLSTKFAGYPGIDLSFNSFQGSIPPLPQKLTLLLLYKNRFSGSIPFLCGTMASPYGGYLDFSDNQLSGELPNCLMQWLQFNVINLSNNNFSGKIPNSIDSNCYTQSLHLRNNSFTGEIPSSLKNCTRLTVLDVGNNKFSGTIPAWIGDSLVDLAVVSLRSNQFHGRVPMKLCNLEKLQVLDLSHNDISGTMPKCVNNLTAMAVKESPNVNITYAFPLYLSSGGYGPGAYYKDHAMMVWKGTDSEYKNTLGLVRSIDLSSNKLAGKIPEEITSLVGLISLNLSSNNLTGPIPRKVGQLNLLNTLDLSQNLLTGEIPESFTQLNFLGYLNLSYNNLSGKIPSGSTRFEASAYTGNDELCGLPLSIKCAEEEPAQDPGIVVDDNEDGLITEGFYISTGVGFIIGFCGIVWYFTLENVIEMCLFPVLRRLKDKIYVLIAENIGQLKRQLK